MSLILLPAHGLALFQVHELWQDDARRSCGPALVSHGRQVRDEGGRIRRLKVKRAFHNFQANEPLNLYAPVYKVEKIQLDNFI